MRLAACSFIVLGEPNETVAVALIAPPAGVDSSVAVIDVVAGGTVVVVEVVVGSAGRSEVECSHGSCRVT